MEYQRFKKIVIEYFPTTMASLVEEAFQDLPGREIYVDEVNDLFRMVTGREYGLPRGLIQSLLLSPVAKTYVMLSADKDRPFNLFTIDPKGMNIEELSEKFLKIYECGVEWAFLAEFVLEGKCS